MPVLVNLKEHFERAVDAEFAAQPRGASTVLADADVALLPSPVARYVRASGAIGRPRPQSMRVAMSADMRRKPGQKPMVSTAVQYSFFTRPARLFLMDARMFGLPVRALHIYRNEAATFQVRVASLVPMVDLSGPVLTSSETVTVLNDLCVMAPGALVDPRLTWAEVDDRSAKVTFTNGPHVVTATLVVDRDDRLVDFWSDDRPDGSSGSEYVDRRWSTPLWDYREMDGVRTASRGNAVYAHPEGPFAYGEFRIDSVTYDPAPPRAVVAPSRPSPAAT